MGVDLIVCTVCPVTAIPLICTQARGPRVWMGVGRDLASPRTSRNAVTCPPPLPTSFKQSCRTADRFPSLWLPFPLLPSAAAMSVVWLSVFFLLCVELIVTAVLVLPLPRVVRKSIASAIFRFELAKRVRFFINFTILACLFAIWDCVQVRFLRQSGITGLPLLRSVVRIVYVFEPHVAAAVADCPAFHCCRAFSLMDVARTHRTALPFVAAGYSAHPFPHRS